MPDETRAERIIRFAAELFRTQPITTPLPADTGAIPQRAQGCADSCAPNEDSDAWPAVRSAPAGASTEHGRHHDSNPPGRK